MKSLEISTTEKFVYGPYVYSYERINQDRKTISLTVTPDSKIVLRVPKKADAERTENFLKRKWFWLEKQLKFFKKYHRRTYAKEYVSGESFLYLGRQYKLVVKESKEDFVGLLKGVIAVNTTKPKKEYIQKLIERWYKEKTERYFMERYADVKSRFQYKEFPVLSIRDMKKRWGSFVGKDKIILNPKLIQASKDCIDYVLVHELCHMRYKNHDKKFFKFLTEKYPHWEKVKEKLELYLA